MKLLNKTTSYFLIPAIVIIIVCAITQFLMVNSRIIERVDKQLLKEKKLIIRQLKDLEGTEEKINLYKTLKSDIDLIEDVEVSKTKERFYSSEYFDIEDNESIPIRVLEFSSEIQERTFKVKIRKPLDKTRDFIYGLVGANILLFAGLIIISIIVNRFISSQVWKPFYETLEKLEKFNISYPIISKSQPTNIYEFDLLNNEIEFLIKKITRDFNNYKHFIENVSHELQTPIAVIKSKLDLLIQSKVLQESEHIQLSSITSNLNKLTRINQSLILLLKIENQLFAQREENNVSELLYASFKNFDDIIVIKNSIKHNVQKGFIKIYESEGKLIIQNSGVQLTSKPEFLFERFKKESKNSDSSGLGLSIVHQICKTNNFSVKYINQKDLHIIQLSF
jgi:signal transduction histidine kinase